MENLTAITPTPSESRLVEGADAGGGGRGDVVMIVQVTLRQA